MDYRYVTALYRSHAAAELVRQELMAIGAAQGDIHVIPEAALLTEGEPRTDWASGLHALDLPAADIEKYESHLRRGDVLVSARVGVDLAPLAEEAMRRPGEFAHMHGDPIENYRPTYRGEPEELARDPLVAEAHLAGMGDLRRG